ncbi:MAG: Rieske 2Fe-2S domain-containing protein [Methanoregulaceae archaeon]|jgi:3-phenylpropionate/trans-cinnamate dioxygenase ferredoxin subunit|nr:Rieske 2Fe-2S domain-containing protein [Methanoregulaceae archaeon]
MSSFTRVAEIAELPDGTMKKVTVGEKEILIARSGSRYFAADDRCPHMNGDLSLGTLSGTVVTCPVHHSQFDLTDGRVVRWTDFTGFKLSAAKLLKSPKPLTTHEIKVEGNGIFVALKEG